jgi:tryptophan synthase alpha chain
LLVPYVTAGYDESWLRSALALASSRDVDAIEIGLPFSDPVMDGPVIQRASVMALNRGTRVDAVLDTIVAHDWPVPVIAMAYTNTASRIGYEQFAAHVAAAHIGGVILADLPVDESATWRAAATDAGVASVFLAAPTSTPARWAQVRELSTGFIYGVGSVGVTGERALLDSRLGQMLEVLRASEAAPVLIGVGVSSAEHATAAAAIADGVIVGSGVMRRLLDEDVDAALAFVRDIRVGLDLER